MAATPGVCSNTTECDAARSGRIIAIPLGEPFICPDCAKSLTPPSQATPPPAAARMPMAVPLALVGAGLFVLGGAIFLGRQLGDSAPAPIIVASLPTPRPIAPAVAHPPAALPPVKSAATLPAPAAAVPAPIVTPPSVPAPPVSAQSVSAQPTPASPVSIAALSPPVVAPSTPPLPVSAPAAGPSGITQPVKTAAVSPQAAPAAPTPAISATPKAAPPVPPASLMAAVATPLPSPEPPTVPDQPFSSVPETGGTPAYPPELAADGRTGRVAVTCQIQTDGAPSACRAAARSGGPAFATAALAWLAHGHVRFHPIILHGKPTSAVRTWTVGIEEAPAMLAEAKRKLRDAAPAQVADAVVQAAPAHAPSPQSASLQPKVQQVAARQMILAPQGASGGIDRPFSTRVASGGAPVFPAFYDENRPGAVTVSCTIGPNGTPSGCRVLKVLGGSGFGKAVETWLGSGRVRFNPILSNGNPVAKQETWTVVFNEVPVAAYPE